MDAGLPGQETVGCFASDKNVSTQLPASLQKPAFQPLPGITSMEQIAAQMREAAGTGSTIGLAQLQWEVTPKRPTAPGN
jgi:hypothetical protein